MTKSTRKPKSRKAATDRPKKPYADFPLTPHASGAWQKKILGKVHYFGRWAKIVKGKLTRIEGDGWQEALTLYKAQADDLHAGRTPRTKAGGLTVMELCNRFLTAKKNKVAAGELTERTFVEYRQTTDRLVATFGKDRLVDDLASDDFESLRADLAKTWGPVRLGNEIQKVRTVFKYGYEAGLIDRPVRFGPEFRKPSKSVMRKHRASKEQRMFSQAEIGAVLEAASVQVRAMLLLGINAGFGNHDCGTLPLKAVDLDKGWIKFPRPKTGVERRCPLWPETVEALKTAIADRPTPKEFAKSLVFVTKYGGDWANDDGKADPIATEISKLLRRPRCPKCGRINPQDSERCQCKWKPTADQPWGKLHREGLGFYALRHTFRTIADATRDFPAVRLVMGHADGSIDDVYREHIDDSRLKAVVDHVHGWLFPILATKANGAEVKHG